MPLNDNQRKFIDLYRASRPRNATRAYEAVYKAKGADARRAASRLLSTNVDIQTAIAEADAEDLRDLGLTAADLLRDIARLAFSDPRQLFDESGALKPISALSDDIAPAISGVDVTESWVPGPDGEPILQRARKVRLWNKNDSQKLLAQYLQLLVQKIELDVRELPAAERHARIEALLARRNGTHAERG
jgi:phage terminase small subunit